MPSAKGIGAGSDVRASVIDLTDETGAPDPAVEILLEVAETLSTPVDVARALEQLASLALRATRAERCAVFLADPECDTRLLPVVGAVSSGDPKLLRRQFRETEPIDITGEATRAELWRNPRAVTIDDASGSPLIPPAWKTWGSKSVALSPLRAGGETFGLLAVDYVQISHKFLPEEGRLLDAIACAAGIALRSARLVERVQHGLEVQRRLFECCAVLLSENSLARVLDLVADGFVSLLRAPHCRINLLSPSRDRFRAVASRGSGVPPEDVLIADLPADGVRWIRNAWERDPHRPLVIPRVKNLTEWRHLIPSGVDVGLLVPLSEGRQILGFLVAGREGPRFDDPELAVASAFADQAAVAVARARMNEALQVRLHLIEALYRLSDLVVGSSNVRTLLASLNETAFAEVGVECLRVTFLDPVLRELLALTSPTESEEAIIRSWRREARARRRPVVVGEPTGETLGLPVCVENRVAGIFWVRAKGGASTAEIDLVHAIAAGLGEVTYKAKLRRTVERRSRELAIAAERERIARDLHDTVGQTLYGIGLKLQDVLVEVEDLELAAKLGELRELAARGVADVRSAVYALSFLHVRARGFLPSLRALVRQFTRATGIVAELRVEGSISALSEEVENALYRVAHEALVNVDRHARATGVVVSLLAYEGQIELAIRDDGVGLDQRQAADWQSAAHFGLRTMARSIEEIEGRFNVSRASPRGLLIRATVPLHENR